MPVGFKLGQQIAAFNRPFLVILGFVLGLVVVLAEPAVHVLNKQVYEATGGGVKKLEMFIALSVAVGTSIGLSLIRMIPFFGIILSYPGLLNFAGIVLLCSEAIYGYSVRLRRSGKRTADFKLYFTIRYRRLRGVKRRRYVENYD